LRRLAPYHEEIELAGGQANPLAEQGVDAARNKT
jgi:hypothetical protein